MKTYVKNILLYLAALLGLLSFVALFSNPLERYDSIQGTWSVYNVRAYLGESFNGETTYRGAILPIFGFVVPLLLAIVLIIESFNQSWLKKLKIINTVLAILFFLSAIVVLLTKELFLSVNDYGESALFRNGSGPIFSAITSSVAALVLLFVTWFPSKTEIKFIEK